MINYRYTDNFGKKVVYYMYVCMYSKILAAHPLKANKNVKQIVAMDK